MSSTNQSLGLRKSSRQSLQYKSNQFERKCIIWTKDHLQNISLKRTVDGTCKAGDTLTEYAESYLKSKSEILIDSINRILLIICCKCKLRIFQ